MTRSRLELQFSALWGVRYPELPPTREHVLPVWQEWAQELKRRGRRRRSVPMRADFAWPDARVALELQGGTWVTGGHSTGQGIERDAIKALLAQSDGWALVAFTDAMLRSQTEIWLPRLAVLIRSRLPVHSDG